LSTATTTATTTICAHAIGHEAEPTFFRGVPGRRGDGRNGAARSILMGDWCDSFAVKRPKNRARSACRAEA